MIIECVPNISHGKNLKAMEEIQSKLERMEKIKLLDWHSDIDHGRSVLTFIGKREGIKEAIFFLIEEGIRLFNMEQHEGVHPYLGVIDVIPLIPIIDSTIEDCISIARQVGDEIANRYQIPVYLYGRAASKPHRIKLSQIRGHGYHIMKERIKEDPPDFGRAGVHPTAGVVIVGVREFLVAYNINLKSTDLRCGKEIAKVIREKDGGMKGLQALAFFLESKNCVQVSMNITRPMELTIEQVKSRVEEEAKSRNIEILEDEFVGLLPEKVISEAKKFK